MRLVNRRSVLDSTSNALTLYNVMVTHCMSIKLGTISDTDTANNILKHYTKPNLSLSLKFKTNAVKLFDEMPKRDSVTYNTMITSYVNSGDFDSAWVFYRSMIGSWLRPDVYTFGSLLKGIACSELSRFDLGQQVHCLLVKLGYEDNVYAGSALVDMYAKCGFLGSAYSVFLMMPERNTVSWNALVHAFVKAGDRDGAFSLLKSMGKENVKPDDGTFSPLLTSLDDERYYVTVRVIHSKIIRHGLDVINNVCNALIAAYSDCGSLNDAKRMFVSSFDVHDLVTLNSMLAAYLAHKQQESAFQLFLDMQRLGFEPDIYTHTSIVSACDEEHVGLGSSLHGLVIKKGLEQSVAVGNALLTMYLRCSKKFMHDVLQLFESMEFKDRVTWNTILTGFSQAGFNEEALKLFKHMRLMTVDIDHYTLSAILRSCSDLAALQLGQQIHSLALRLGLELNEFVASSLIFMYSKCGVMEDARTSFEETPKDSSIVWNSIMFGFAQHGEGNVALDLFVEMRERKVKVDHITFVAVLTACSHIGLVEQGRHCLKTMESDYGIPPRQEHYACAVDLFGRAGYLDEAKALIESMPYKPDSMVWKTMLGACRACGDIDYATLIANHLLEIEPEEHCTYVILSNMYGCSKMWKEKAHVTRLMRERKVKKVAGSSWIEVNNEFHAFIAGDHLHAQSDEIYDLLGQLKQVIDLEAHLLVDNEVPWGVH